MKDKSKAMRNGLSRQQATSVSYRRACRIVMLTMILSAIIVSVVGFVTYGVTTKTQSAQTMSSTTSRVENDLAAETKGTVGSADNADADNVAYASKSAIATGQRASFQTIASTFHRGLLSQNAQRAYDQVLSMLMSRKEHGYVSVTEPEDMSSVLGAVLDDHPEIFWAAGSVAFTTNPMTGVSDATPKYSYAASDIQGVWGDCESAIDEFVNRVPADASEYERLQSAYEYVIKRTEYTEDAANSRSIVGCLVDGKGVCVAYARTLQLLLSRLGIWSTYMTGKTSDGTSHAWLLVRIDGKYVHCDPTFGDPSYDASTVVTNANDDKAAGLPDVSYDYMCVSTETITGGGRVIDDYLRRAMPETTDSYDWYRMNDAYVDSDDSDVPRQRIESSLVSGDSVVRLRYATPSAFEDAVRRLADGSYVGAGTSALMLSHGKAKYRYVISRPSGTVWILL